MTLATRRGSMRGVNGAICRITKFKLFTLTTVQNPVFIQKSRLKLKKFFFSENVAMNRIVGNYCERKFNRIVLGTFSFSCLTVSSLPRVKAKTALTPQPIVLAKKKNEEKGFTWGRLWCFLKNYAFQLGFGIAMAMTSAYFNLQIPLCLGSITTVLADIIKRDATLTASQYIELMKQPALKFAACVTAQAVATALTISSIGAVGEGLAVDLRKELFQRFQRQDLVFFEMHQSGDLIKRINDDVAQFKSDFKKLIGQGIKQGSQGRGFAMLSMHKFCKIVLE